MGHISIWHGCQLVVWASAAVGLAAPPPGPNLTRVRTKVFDVEYRVNSLAMPLDAVRLWYTQNKGATWQLYGLDPDRQPPIRFNAPQEGLYGFHLVATNRAGSSGSEPQAGTAAQRWVYVDYTPPVVQLHRPQTHPPDADTLSIRWSAIDGHLPPRPISLAYKMAPNGEWHTMVTNLANTGRYDWPIPDELQGRVVVRVTVVDQGTNRVEAASTFELAPRPATQTVDQPRAAGDRQPGAVLTAGERLIDEKTRTRSRQLYQAAVWHRRRGEHRLAMARLRDALRLDPTLSLALSDMASILYDQGDYQASLEACQLALRQSPSLRSGLEGAARAGIALRQFGLAGEHLRRIIRSHPNDVRAWLNLGDVAIYKGDELAARDHYRKAASLDPSATEVITQAQMRLADLSWLRERYQQTSSVP